MPHLTSKKLSFPWDLYRRVPESQPSQEERADGVFTEAEGADIVFPEAERVGGVFRGSLAHGWECGWQSIMIMIIMILYPSLPHKEEHSLSSTPN